MTKILPCLQRAPSRPTAFPTSRSSTTQAKLISRESTQQTCCSPPMRSPSQRCGRVWGTNPRGKPCKPTRVLICVQGHLNCGRAALHQGAAQDTAGIWAYGLGQGVSACEGIHFDYKIGFNYHGNPLEPIRGPLRSLGSYLTWDLIDGNCGRRTARQSTPTTPAPTLSPGTPESFRI